MKIEFRFHRVLALLLCFCMLVSLTPGAYAAPRDWSYDSVTWVGSDSEGYTSATLHYTNSKNGQTRDVTVTATVNENASTEPRCTTAGATVYTAQVTPQQAPDGRQRSVNKQVAIPATGIHRFNRQPTTTWATDYLSCTASGQCLDCHKSVTETTQDVVFSPERACEDQANGTATATFKATYRDGTQYRTVTATARNITVPGLGHDWGEVEYVWAQDGSAWKCTATQKCGNDTAGAHTRTQTVTAVGEVLTPAACETDGTTRYTATFTTEGLGSDTKDVQDIPSIGHAWSSDWSKSAEKHWHDCGNSCGEKSDEAEHSWDETQYSWSSTEPGTASCTATNSCTVCGYEARETVDASAAVTLEPTCTERGKHTYSASFTVPGLDDTSTEMADIPALGHTMSHEEKVEATCTEAGHIAGYTCSVCEKHFADAAGEAEIAEADWVIPATGHAWSSDWSKDAEKHWHDCGNSCGEKNDEAGHSWGETQYEWSSTEPGAASCTATNSCTVCGYEASETVTASAEVTLAATCTEQGKHTYSASFTVPGLEDTSTEMADIPALGHTMSHEDALDKTCTTDGHVEGYTCSVCGKHYEDAEGTTEIAEADWVIPASHELSKTEGFAATCTKAGQNDYWTCSVCGAFFSDENGQTEINENDWVLPAKGHAWGEPEYVWAADHSSVTATRVCGNDSSHKQTETVDATGEQTKAPTCEAKGETTYTSEAFENEAFKVQVDTVADIDPLDHDWGEPSYSWDGNHRTVTATRHCQRSGCTEEETEQAARASVTAVKAVPVVSNAGRLTGVTVTLRYTSAAFENKAFEAQSEDVEVNVTVGNNDRNLCKLHITDLGINGYLVGTAQNIKDGSYSVKAEISEDGRDLILKISVDNKAAYAPTTGGYGSLDQSYTLTGEHYHFAWNRSKRAENEYVFTLSTSFTEQNNGSIRWNGWADQTEYYADTYVSEQNRGGMELVIRKNHVGDTLTYTFDLNARNPSATGTAPADLTFTFGGDPVSLPGGDGFQRQGYDFLGWAREEGARTPEYQPGEQIDTDTAPHSPSKQVKLFAVWQRHVYTIELDLDGGTSSGWADRVRGLSVTAGPGQQRFRIRGIDSSDPVNGDAVVVGLQDTETPRVYSFSAGSGDLLLPAQGETIKDYKLKVIWQIDVKYIHDGNTIEKTTATKGSEIKVIAAPSVEGQHFCGWVLDDEDATVYQPGGKLTAGVKNLNFTAHFETLTFEARQEPTCTEDGHFEGYTCPSCGKHFFDPEGTTEINEYDWVIPALGHAWGAPDYAWAADHSSVTATRTCVRGCVETETAALASSEETKAPTCTEKGETTYTSEAFENMAFEAQVDTIPDIDPLDHDWEITYTWAEDNSSVTALKACKRDHEHDITETVDTTSVTEPATCTEPGQITWTAEFENEAFEKQTNIKEILALGHDLVKTEAVEETCTEDGNSEYWTCSRCGKFFSDEAGETEIEEDSWVISALGHELVKTEAVKETCTEAGNSEYWTCSRCGKFFSDEAGENEIEKDSWVIPALGHKAKEEPTRENETLPTCEAAGGYDEVLFCERCGEEMSRVERKIPTLGHDWSEWTVTTDPTCTEKGEETRICARDEEHVETREVEALGHDWGEWTVTTEPTCTEKGEEKRVCARDEEHVETREVEALGHTEGEPVRESEKAATCTEAGSYDEVVYCTVCEEELSREAKAVEALGHDWGEWAVTTEPSCTEKGEETRVCARDDKHVETREVKVLGHTEGEPVRENEKAATCTEAGSYDEVVYCTVCGEELSREAKTIEALGHTEGEPVRENEKAASCTEAGSYDEVVYCTVCGEELSREAKTIEALGHEWGEWELEAEPTCEETGEEVRFCEHDESHWETREVPALGHDWGEWTVTTEPSCTEKGEETRVCARDEEHVETRELEALGHDYQLSGWTWTGFGAAAATFTCSHDEEHTVTVNATLATTRIAAGCETQGRNTYTATAIFEGKTYTDTRTELIPALGHEWGPWTVTKEATEDEEGEETRSCLRDPSHVETRAIARLEPAEEETREIEPEPSVEPVEVPEEPVPQAAPELTPSKPLTVSNLILGLIALLLGLGMAVTAFTKKKRSKLLGLIPAAAAVAIFALTQSLGGPIQAFDKWSVLMGVCAAANGALAYLTRAVKSKA